jgi:hypothetical protein
MGNLRFLSFLIYSLVGDGLTVMRDESAKKLRQVELTEKMRFDNLIPIFGLFHLMWEILRLVYERYWGGSNLSGSLSNLQAQLGQKEATKDAKKFRACDEFVYLAAEVLFKEIFRTFAEKDLSKKQENEKVKI